MGYFNLTIEDPDEGTSWDDHLHIRLCFQIYHTDNKVREQIRFVNRNPVADEDHNVMSADFET